MSRQLTPYEQTQLARYGNNNINIDQIGDTPIEYITGVAEFDGHVFSVTSDVLIPRVETEELLPLVLSDLEKLEKKHFSIADVGTGSGALGVSLIQRIAASHLLLEHAVLSDVSTAAVDVAQKNAQKLLPEELFKKTDCITSDLLASYDVDWSFDVVLANLPYIPSQRIPALDASVIEYEPHIALDGGPDGLKLIRTFLSQVTAFLRPNSIVYLETDHTHTLLEVIGTLPSWEGEQLKDSFGQPRFMRLWQA